MDTYSGQNETADRVDCRNMNTPDVAATDQAAQEMQLLLASKIELQGRISLLERRVAQHELQIRRTIQGGPLSSVQVYLLMNNWIDENSWYDPLGRDKYSQQAIFTAELLIREGHKASTEEYWLELTRRMDLTFSQIQIGPTSKDLDFQPDHQSDLIGAKLARVQALTRWTGEKHRLMNDVRRMLEVFKYETLQADSRSYPIRRIGQSCLYQVPQNKRGLLAPYRSQLVRLVCVSHRFHGIYIMVGRAGR